MAAADFLNAIQNAIRSLLRANFENSVNLIARNEAR
jgi:hypothetical protein